jgi:hypothetical protein
LFLTLSLRNQAVEEDVYVLALMPTQRAEQANIPIHVMPNGDTAGARGAALEALKLARQSGLA